MLRSHKSTDDPLIQALYCLDQHIQSVTNQVCNVNPIQDGKQ